MVGWKVDDWLVGWRGGSLDVCLLGHWVGRLVGHLTIEVIGWLVGLLNQFGNSLLGFVGKLLLLL